MHDIVSKKWVQINGIVVRAKKKMIILLNFIPSALFLTHDGDDNGDAGDDGAFEAEAKPMISQL